MGISVFPLPAAASVLETKAVTVPAATTGYILSSTFGASTYTITCPSTVAATVAFEDSAGAIGKATTSSGSVQLSLSRDADKAVITTNAGTNVIVTITPSGRSLSPVATGTPTEYTSSASITNSGLAYAVIVGGGGGGCAAGAYPGGSGGSGGISAGYIPLAGSATVSVGGGGGGGEPNGGYGGGGGGGGGTTTLSGTGFTTLTANGGGGGGYSLYNGAAGGGGGSGSGGEDNVNGNNGGNSSNASGGSAVYNGNYKWVKSGTLGEGGTGPGRSPSNVGYGGGGAAGGRTGEGWGGDGKQGAVWLLEI